jgi:hypothetical protein
MVGCVYFQVIGLSQLVLLFGLGRQSFFRRVGFALADGRVF